MNEQQSASRGPRCGVRPTGVRPTGVRLTMRRHVDLLRVASAGCRASR
ncbi:putative leader peptide [Speluncibacter jeojiensis]